MTTFKSRLVSFLWEPFVTSSVNTPFGRSRCLRLETLETRELLSADGGVVCGPDYIDQTEVFPESLSPWTESETVDSGRISEEENVKPSVSFSAIYAAAAASEVDELTGSAAVGDATTEVVFPAFVDNGTSFYRVDRTADLNSDNPSVRRLVFASQLDGDEPSGDVCVIEDLDESGNELTSDYGSGGGETWTLAITVNACSSLTSDSGSISLSEGRPLPADPDSPLSSADYFTIALPALPDNYVGSITFSGTAACGSDYGAYTLCSANLSAPGGSTIYFSGGGSTLYIIPFGDSIVEDHETITASLGTPMFQGSGGGEDVTFVNGVTSVTARIIDDDALTLDSVFFRNNLNLISDAQGSFGTSWQSGPHWVNGDSAATLPIAYACNDVLQMNATIGGVVQANTCQVKAVRVGGGETEWIDFPSSGNMLYTFTESFTEIFGYQKGCYISASTIVWKFRLNGGGEREFASNADRSVNPLYITYKTPTVATNDYLFHTSLHHSCVAAGTVEYRQIEEGDTAEVIAGKIDANCDRIYQAVCEKFGSLNVEKINLVDGNILVGEALTYYGKDLDDDSLYSTIKANLEFTSRESGNTFDQLPSRAREFYNSEFSTSNKTGLLYHLDGTCGAWQNFFVNTLLCQGLGNVSQLGIVREGDYSTNHFKVKTDVHGQGNIIPRENTWGDHVIVQYKNWFFDPSYGISCGTSRRQAVLTIISNLESVGVKSSVQSSVNSGDGNTVFGYGYRYAPEKEANEIELLDLRIIDV